MEGTVTTIASVSCTVDTEQGAYTCSARRRLTDSDTGESKPLAVGDRVVLEPTGELEGVISEVLPRRTRLSRTQPHDPRKEHVIVANVDQLLIVNAARRPPLRVGLIDRYIIAAEHSTLDPIICINKIDLARRKDKHLQVAELYRSLDYRVLFTSALDGTGMEELKGLLCDKSTVLAGHSGVGKSSLINALQPGLKLKTGIVRRSGRHVTSTVSLLRLDFGGYVVDTPGIREFSLWDIQRVDVAQFFSDIWELSHHCGMPDCTHDHEPECAVKAAAESGELPRVRYESYMGILESIAEWSAPRDTDVERPREQIRKSQRRASRPTRKQQLRRDWEEDMADELADEEADEEMDDD